jgi:N-succinyldiaminopimelate aminotransferase
MPTLANRMQGFGTTIFTTINALADEHNAINLGQGAPNFDTPPDVVQALVDAMHSGKYSQYANGWGAPVLRQAVADHSARFYDLTINPDTEVVVTVGATGGLFDALYGSIDPGDEVIVIEPFYDIYVPIIETAGGVVRYVPLQPPTWTIDEAALRAAFNERTRAIVINTPNNPTGRVFSNDELNLIADLCIQYDAICISDEVYEHLTYDGARHTPIATLPGMFERNLRVSSMAKTFSATGWKIGWVTGPANLMQGVWRAHQLTSFAIFHAGQMGAAHALNMADDYFNAFNALYDRKRDLLLEGLNAAGLKPLHPQGAFYIMADFSDLHDGGSMAFTEFLASKVGVACIPPGSFYSDNHRHIGDKHVRFAYCKTDDVLEAACERLATLKQRV